MSNVHNKNMSFLALYIFVIFVNLFLSKKAFIRNFINPVIFYTINNTIFMCISQYAEENFVFIFVNFFVFYAIEMNTKKVYNVCVNSERGHMPCKINCLR